MALRLAELMLWSVMHVFNYFEKFILGIIK